jgi:PAS domain S-box-containing protein
VSRKGDRPPRKALMFWRAAADKKDVTAWVWATLLIGLAALALAVLVGRLRRRVAAFAEENRDLERSVRILEEERHVLELIARGATLREVLEALTEAIENIVPGVICSVLLVDRERGVLKQGAAPRLPAQFWKLCDGVPLDPDLGCCPAAAFLNETVITEDIATDPRWASIRDQVVGLGLRSCWSVPIRHSDSSEVIGTFAMYRTCPSKPSAPHVLAVQAGAHLAGNAIERLRAGQALRDYAERFAMAEKAARFGIWEWDLTAGNLELSAGASRITGFGREAVRLGYEQVISAIHPDDRNAARRARERTIAENLPYEYEFRRIVPDGSIRWLRVQGRVQEVEGRTKLLGAIMEITAQKELLLGLESAKLAAEAATRAKSEFLANLSHEIRTPMNGILGFTELTLETPLTEAQRSSLMNVRACGESLLQIINDILDFSKIEAGCMELENTVFSVSECVRFAAKTIEPQALRKGLEVTCEIAEGVPELVKGDQNRLRQVLLNLSANALKFTEQGRIAVRVILESQRENVVTLQFSVQDTGIGIAPEKHQTIFEAFRQADGSITRRYGGSGLGLAISKKLVTLFGGTIAVESAPGAGSTFRFTAQFEAAALSGQAPSREPNTVSPAFKRKLSILLAEDHATNRELMVRVLRARGHEVVTVSNGLEAVRSFSAGKYDLVLMDVQMPEMDGFEATRAIRWLQQGRHVPIVALTASAMSGDREMCLQAGMNGYLSKPLAVPKLDEMLESVATGAFSEDPAENPAPSHVRSLAHQPGP